MWTACSSARGTAGKLLRLEKIKALVPLDTPEQRLYLRMCIALLDMPETKKQKE